MRGAKPDCANDRTVNPGKDQAAPALTGDQDSGDDGEATGKII